ncbi:MAG: sulfate ABC transporter permease subunit CysW [Elusimicrobia bacterium]|nr:sulfate ABC transporter permease subunit CysW [Elusimicrobiota bacterium]MBK8422490.1 sulfate ABC transporter permease subunit CysW [Elusimicrobiota bacterium]MBK9693797.1 sulfate ABC transporter permease subunit CysW [Elusimicrobiota bacterium]
MGPAAAGGVRVNDSHWVRRLVLVVVFAFLGLFLALPLVVVFANAFGGGAAVFVGALVHPDTRAALGLTLAAAAVAVPLNTLFGLAAAWAVTRFRFPGKNLLVTLIDLPFSVSPVIAGLLFVLLFGTHGWFGPWLASHGVKIVFAVPGVILVTAFVTAPFVARELIPLMQTQGIEEEEAAHVLGASGVQMFWRVTLPKIKWGLLYGVVLSAARAVGEFGAVSVVSGHIRGKTNTLSLHIESLYDDYQFAAAFAVASLLVAGALLSLVLKSWLEYRVERRGLSR